jgi:AraC family transcriptional regulator
LASGLDEVTDRFNHLSLDPKHFHSSFELLHCWDGEVTEWLEDNPIMFKQGDWLLIPPGFKHKTLNQTSKNFTYITLMFDIDDPELRRELKSLSNILVTKEDAALTEIPHYLMLLDSVLLNVLLKHKLNDDKQSSSLSISERLSLQACILLILKDVMSLLKQNKERMEENDKVAGMYAITIANQIEEMLSTSLDERDATVQQIARRIGISRNRCTQLFSKVFGISPRQYLKMQRLLRAKEKLSQTDQSIESIALELGFSSLSHFSRQFKRWTGTSPSNYRPQHKVMERPFLKAEY